MRIRVFSTATCPICIKLKSFLNENNIEFENLDVGADSKARDEMISSTKQLGVPVIQVDDEWIIGFDEAKFREILHL